MTNVWAYRVGNWVDWPTEDWSRPVQFSGLKDLIEKLKQRELTKLEKLAICADGDVSGLVKLDEPLTPATFSRFKPDFIGLNEFLVMYSKLVFVACVAGEGKDGSALLKMISTVIGPQKYVVGFDKQGAFSQMTSEPGQVKPTLGRIPGVPFPDRQFAEMKGSLDENSFFSKWAMGGQIVRLNRLEQGDEPGKRCGWPSCKGHANAGDRCVAVTSCGMPGCKGHLAQLDRCKSPPDAGILSDTGVPADGGMRRDGGTRPDGDTQPDGGVRPDKGVRPHQHNR
jgi:hypothetical protein